MTPTPGQLESPEVHLALITGRRLEAHYRIYGGVRSHLPHVLLQLRVSAGIAGAAQLLEQSLRREQRKGLEPSLDDRLIPIQLPRHGRPCPVTGLLAVEIPVQLTRLNPVVHRTAADPEALGQLGLTHPLLQIVA